MGRRKKVTAQAETPALPPTPRYEYIGTPGPMITFPGKNLKFRPDKITDNQVTAILQSHPDLKRYFRDRAAGEEE